MKVSKQKAAEHRDEILVGASKLFREKGPRGVGIAAASWAKTLNSAVGEVYEKGGYILSPQKVLTKQYALITLAKF